MSFNAVGVGALNKDMFFEVDTEKLTAMNTELDEKGFKLFILGEEDFGKSEELEPTLQIVKKYAKPMGEGLGGSAANVIVGLSRMGFKTGYLGLVGYDEYFLRRCLEREGVDTSRVFVGRRSGVCISISDGKDRALRVYPNSNDLLGLRYLNALDTLEGYLGKSEIVHMTSFVCSLGYEPLEAQTKIAEQLGKRIRISFGPGELYANLGLEKLKPILQNTYILFVNRNEVQILTKEDYREGTRKLLEYGPLYVVCTLGKDGAYLRYSNGEFFAKQEKILKKEIISKELTGAGDYFASGVLAGLLKGKSPEDCVYLGNRVASMKLRGLEREAYQKIEI